MCEICLVACVELSHGPSEKWPPPQVKSMCVASVLVAASVQWIKQKPRSECFGDLLVAPTGVDPVTFRFSVERSTN